MKFKIFTLLACLVLASCGGIRTFHDYARAGDTVALPVGMQSTFNKDNINVTITPSIGAPIVLSANDPSIRAILNLYPDPISSMIVSREIGEELTPGVSSYEITTRFSANEDKDWYQTTVFIDLPITLPTGLTNISVTDGQGNSHSLTMDIIAGTGNENTFLADIIGAGSIPLTGDMLDSLARVPHTVVFVDTSTTIPNAIEINFTHDPDSTIGGVGNVFVVNPLGYKKSMSWSDDGINLKVILTESRNGIIDHMNDYKLYITGTVTNVQMNSVTGYDNNGNEVIGITASLTQN